MLFFFLFFALSRAAVFDLQNTNIDSAGVSFAFSNASGLVSAQSIWSTLGTNCPFVTFGSQAFYTYGCVLDLSVIEKIEEIESFEFLSDKSFPQSDKGLDRDSFLLANVTPLQLTYSNTTDCDSDLEGIKRDTDCKLLMGGTCSANNITLTCEGGLICTGCVIANFESMLFDKAEFVVA